MRVRTHLAVLGVAVGLVALHTWPLVRDPGHLVPDNTDPWLFSWVMLSVFRNLLARPALLLHGSGFYPFGSSLTFAEPLLTPALVAGPLHALTGNPWLAYNLTLVLFWAVSGWATYAVAYWITGRHPAAAAAMLVFTVSRPRIEYAVEFQMEMLFGLPLGLYLLARFVETQRPRYLAGCLAVFWLQAVAVWYVAVLLGFALLVLALASVPRRWTGWRWRTLAWAAVGAVALAAALAPVAWPYFVTRRELGLERALGDALERSADLLTYLTTDGTWLRRLVRVHYVAETSLFPGLLALLLAALGLAGSRRGPADPPAGWPERLVQATMAASLVLGAWTVAGDGRLRIGSAWTRLPSVTTWGLVLLGGLLVAGGLEGWRRWRAGLADRRLGEREWAAVLAAVGLVALLLSFGPVVEIGGLDAESGLYAWLHPYLLPLRAIRGTTRFGLLVLLVIALLAGLGVSRLLDRLPRRAGAAVATLLIAALLLDYAHGRLRYEREPAATPVGAALARLPGDAAVLEWPMNRPGVDVEAKLRSLEHGRRVVNGFAGFVLEFHRELSGLLAGAGPGFRTAAAEEALARIYPLGFVVVRRDWLPPGARAGWEAVRTAPGGPLRLLGTYGADDLYAFAPAPARGSTIERLVSYEFLRTHPRLRLGLRALPAEGVAEHWATVSLNGTVLLRTRLEPDASLAAEAGGPLRQVAPNAFTILYGYRRAAGPDAARRRIGRTGVTSPVDLLVESAGQPHGDRASIRIARGELAVNQRGYSLVAIDPAGRVVDRALFDTYADSAASAALAAWVAAQPPGTIVAGAVRNEASERLTGAAVAALATLGVAGDLRGHFTESHAFVGVKGAPPGSALEALGPRPVQVRIGQPERIPGLEVTEFALEPAPVAAPGGR